jgi:membrane-bound lytic murein transglycosylase B
VRIKHRVSRGVRAPVFGIALITPVVLAGAVAAAPGNVGAAAHAVGSTPAVAPAPESTGFAVVAAAKPPANFRFAATSSSLPPPAAVINSPGGMRIPGMALSAYRKAEQAMSVASPGCGVSWNLLAGIGRIESSHANGGATDSRGTAIRPIYGPALDGTLPGNEIIMQSSAGGRAVYARAMGPMQFLPGTWSRYASDGDGDGRADPQNLFDATLSAARYLCSGGLNLRNQSQALTAILRYNNSMAYAQNVLGWAAAYATGVAPVDLPVITGPVPALGDTHLEVSPEGLGPQMPGLHLGDPMADLGLMTMGNTEAANQLSAPGPMPASPMLPSEHGCQVICMASQLPPEATQAAQNLPPWMQPMAPPPWMAPPPAPWMTPPVAPAPMGLPPGPAAEAPPAAPAPAPAPGTPPWMAPPPAPAPAPEPVVAADAVPTLAPGPGPLPGPAS